MEELKPCPFCGGEADWETEPMGLSCTYHTIFCWLCGATISCANKKEAIDAWNKRVLVGNLNIDPSVIERLNNEVE